MLSGRVEAARYTRRVLLGGALVGAGAAADRLLLRPESPPEPPEDGSLNVKSFGATGDGVTDDRAAWQKAVDAANQARYGGIVVGPPGDYLIGPPGLVMPTNAQKPIKLQGTSMAGTGEIGTRLKRNGPYTLLTAKGTGTAGTEVNTGLSLADLTLWGADASGSLVILEQCAHVTFERVRLAHSADPALLASQLWNSSFYRCNFEGSGSAPRAIPAVLITSGVSLTDTVQLTNCIFESNAFDDLVLDGAPGKPANAVQLANCKFERSGGVGLTFRNAQYSGMVGGSMYTSSAGPCVREEGGSFNNRLVGVNFASNPSPAAPQLVHLVHGRNMVVVGNSFYGGAAANVHLEEGYGVATVWANVHERLASEAFVADARTAKSGLVQGDRQPVGGSRGGNEALADLLRALAATGLIEDGSKP